MKGGNEQAMRAKRTNLAAGLPMPADLEGTALGSRMSQNRSPTMYTMKALVTCAAGRCRR